MQNNISGTGTFTAPQDSPTKLTAAALAVIGGIATAALLLRTVEAAAAGWSPTETAKICFHYPELHAAPDREELTRLLMSAAFFGTDAFYFDSGEENTGIPEFSTDRASPPSVAPSDSEEPQSPELPLDGTATPFPTEPSFDIYSFDRAAVPKGELAVIPYDLSLGAADGEVLLSNTTAYEIDTDAYLTAEYPIRADISSLSESEPLVLILHTHGTEAYTENGAVSVSPNAIQRSSDTSENVVAVGAVMAELLNGAGIPTLHCEIMHDLESYRRSYDLAADTAQKYLTLYPSIKYIFDVHRDAVATSDGDLIRPVTVINGEVCAQVMLVVGTNEKGADHPDWETNFTAAAHWQSRLTDTYDRFARPINIRGASFNAQFAPGAMLLEIGSAANSLEEAKNAAKYLTYSLIELIKSDSN